MKKAVLIAPANDFAGNLNVARFTTLLAPPMGILALGSYLAAHDVPVELIDVQMDFGFGLTRDAESIVAKRVASHLQAQVDSIAWLGISQLSNSGSGVALAQELHRAMPDIPVIFGGYFPSTAFQPLLQEFSFISAIVRGDGEAAALEISRSLDEGCPFLTTSTPNLAWLEDGTLRTSPTQSMSLSDLPPLNFQLLHNPSSYQIIDLVTSRGCPFSCNYCLERAMRSYAEYPLSWVDRQLAHLEEELPNDHVFIYDPVFGLRRKRTVEMCSLLRERRFSYAIESRVDVLAPSLIPALRNAGVESIYLGIESASEPALRRMEKLRSSESADTYLEKALEILEACFESGITPVLGFMLGFPGDTEEDYRTTLEFVKVVGELHDRVLQRAGMAAGFVTFAFFTKLYEGSRIAERVEQDFPDVVLRSEPFIGELTVLSPSQGVGLDLTRHYQSEIVKHGRYTQLALERLRNFYSFSLETFLSEHPELVEKQGVVVLGDSLQHFPQEFKVVSSLMYYDKSKE